MIESPWRLPDGGRGKTPRLSGDHPGRSSRRRTALLIAALSGLLLPVWALAQLAPSVQADLLLVQTEAYMKEKRFEDAREAMGKILKLQEEHGLTLPVEFHFKYAQVAEVAGAYKDTIASLNHYLQAAGQQGTYYREALELLHQAMEALVAEDDAAYERARQAGTAAAYGSYLRAYPEGRHVATARRLQTAAQAQASRAARAARDDQAYERSRRADTVAAYESYLKTYPSGRHAREARQWVAWARTKEAWVAEAERQRRAGVGRQFRDCQRCPLMVEVPSGWYLMGSLASEEARSRGEGPRHRVTIGEPFAVGVYEVTFVEWDACVQDGGCNGYRYRPDDRGWGRGKQPVIRVSWEDAQAYVRWLSRETGAEYRLLSEAEWEYVARAGTTTPFHTGTTISTGQANYDGNYTYGNGRKGEYRGRTVAVGSFAANAFGLHDVHGNVWEGVEDCWNDSYSGAPTDGTAWETGECSRRVLRGGSWDSDPRYLRSAIRGWIGTGNRISSSIGFRVARTLNS